jgi:FkbM family methyltransferase
MGVAQNDLIYDVGLFNGDDTAYYLFREYRVVALDANPIMIERAHSRFSEEIATGRLTLLNIGISEKEGLDTFWISEQPEWSSFDRAIASRDGTEHKPISVPIVRFSNVIEQYGIPHYMKIDIEGNDKLCIQSIRGMTLPKYISVETECVGDNEILSDERALEVLTALHDIGYKQFKLINQVNFTAARSGVASAFLNRVIHSCANGRLRVLGLSSVAAKFTDAGKLSRINFFFHSGSSGPWGNDTPGSWTTFEKSKDLYLQTRHSYFRKPRPLYSFWHDWHATF